MITSDGLPLTVIGGYLGAGKTTVVNRLLADPGGRRLAVVVNDFGELGIDAQLLGEDGVVNLANGCVCCTIGGDLQGALATLTELPDPPDQVIVEASGVADPASVAAWATVPPFRPGGVIVLAAADTVRNKARDRYVGGEVLTQLAAADLVVVTKVDTVDDETATRVVDWCRTTTDGARVVTASFGTLPADLLLGLRPTTAPDTEEIHTHGDDYVRWAWRSPGSLRRDQLEGFLASLPDRVLRLKGFVLLDDDGWWVVDVVGTRTDLRRTDPRPESALEAIAVGPDRLDLPAPDA